MGYYDLATGVQAVTTLQTAHGLPVMTGTSVDTRGAHTAFFVVNVGTLTSTKTVDLKVQMATDAAFTTPVDVTNAVWTQYSTSNLERVDTGRVNVRDCLRYIRVLGTAAGSGNAPISVTVLLGLENTGDGGATSTAATQTAPYAAAFNLQPSDDGS